MLLRLKQIPFVILNALQTFWHIAIYCIRTGRLWSSSEESARRMRVCEVCDYYMENLDMCSECWCIMGHKTKLIKAKCPMGKWK